MAIPAHFTIDIELTNRCNADCYFCPRAATPDQGLMSRETFAQALDRCIEFRDEAADRTGREVRISLCGLGEPLLNKHAAEFVRMVKEAGFFCSLSSNGSLLDAAKAGLLLDAGLNRVDINVGERDEAYEEIYKLPWERTRDNVLHFHQAAKGRCEVNIILVNHREDMAHIHGMRDYWQGLGLENFFPLPLINRGGSLDVDHMHFDELAQTPQAMAMFEAEGGIPECQWPFVSQFIGFDGSYYLCCSDWQKKVPMGTVTDTALLDIVGPKLDYTRERGPICNACNVDPVNFVADRLRAIEAGEEVFEDAATLVRNLLDDRDEVLALLDELAPDALTTRPGVGRKRIPLRIT